MQNTLDEKAHRYKAVIRMNFQLRAKFQIKMLSCSRSMWITNSSDTGGFKLQIFCIRSSYLTHWVIRPHGLNT